MNQNLRIAQWNANGMAQHSLDLQAFITMEKLDIILVCETHFTNFNYFRMHGYSMYNTNAPSGRAHGGSAIIVRNSIRHIEMPNYQTEHIQATSIQITDWIGPLTITSAYLPPRFRLRKNEFVTFFSSLGNRFVVGADYNAKHVRWGSRLTTPRGRELLKAVEEMHLSYISTGEPTYWPTDANRVPDLLDFFITRGVAQNYTYIQSYFDLSSDHSPILLTLSTTFLTTPSPLSLCNKFTDWINFQNLVSNSISFDISLKSECDIDNAIQHLTKTIQDAAWKSTPEMEKRGEIQELPQHIKIAILEKRRLRRTWHISRNPLAKRHFNTAAQKLKRLLFTYKNDSTQTYLENLTATDSTDYSLWKATKKLTNQINNVPPIKRPNGSWAKSDAEKSETFACHLAEVFQPFPSEQNGQDIKDFLDSPFQMSRPIPAITLHEVKEIIKNTNPKKAPGFDLITGTILRHLPNRALRSITLIFNAILRTGYFPAQWKVAEIIVIPKPGKPPNEVSSYRPISLLPLLSKIFEKLLLTKLQPYLSDLFPQHQFGFRRGHSTTEQVHRVCHKISEALEEKHYCSVAFLDIKQAFDKVWHIGLLFKIKQMLPHTFYSIIKSYLTNRYFYVKFKSAQTNLYNICAGVPQGSVLAPILYSLYTSDMPVTENATVATFADDTSILASHLNPTVASEHLQDQLNKTNDWQKKWRMRTNSVKSTHVTFTMRRKTCPPVTFDDQLLPQSTTAKYLGLHLDRRLTWKTHIQTKRRQLNLKFKKLYWLLGTKSKLSTKNKLLIYQTILKPIWSYGVQLWGTAKNSNLQIIQRYQNKTLRTIVNAPWYVPNSVIHRDLQTPSINEEITRLSKKYKDRLETHPNYLAINLLDNSTTLRRLNRRHPTDLF